MVDAVVIGGGISGLTAALALQRAGKSVAVLEAAAQAGGNIRTVVRDGFSMETGPNSFMGSAEFVWRLVGDLGLEDQVETAAAVADNRYIYRHGELLPLPLAMGSFLSTRLLSFPAKVSLAMEPFKRNGARAEETAWEFFVRRFGEEAATYVMSPFISGVYAGDIHTLGARDAFHKFWRFEAESGSMIRGAMKFMKAKRRRLKDAGQPYRKGLRSLRGGLGTLTSALVAALGDGAVYPETQVTTLSPIAGGYRVSAASRSWEAESVVLAAPPSAASRVLGEHFPRVAGPLGRIPLVPVVVVHWTCDNPPEETPPGFGFLVPRVTGKRILGTLFPSQLFRGRAPEAGQLFSSFIGGALDRDAGRLTDDELMATVVREHEEMMGVKLAAPRALAVLRYDEAIPQLVPGHLDNLAFALEALADQPGLVLAGNYLNGVGIEQAVQSGYEAVAALLASQEAVAR